MWNNHLCAVALTFDFDAETLWLSMGKDTPTYLSRGEFGARVGVPRLLALLERYNIKATFFTPGYTAERYPEVMREICERGHEVGHHGYLHEGPTHLSLEEERAVLEKGFESLEKVTGRRPRGYRSPDWDLSHNSVALFKEYGFLYDSSMMASDFHPYPLLLDGQETGVVELPVSWDLDDAPHFHFNFNPYRVGMSAPSKVFEIWSVEFEGAYSEGGVFMLTMHPQYIGRYHRVQLLEQLIRHISSFAGVWFATCTEIAEAWLAQNPSSP